jgi:hypothetical protein
MTSGLRCKVRDGIVSQMTVLNSKLNMLSSGLLHSQQARMEVQEKRESLLAELKVHSRKGHDGKACPAVLHTRTAY